MTKKQLPALFLLIILLSQGILFPQGLRNSPDYFKGHLSGFHITSYMNEQELVLRMNPEIKITINAPSPADFNPNKKVMLIFYALPNFNTTAQTIGKIIKEGDDWHFNIQHIGAQTRFLRKQRNEYNIVVAYLETDQTSWQWWRNIHPDGDRIIKSVVDSVESIFKNYKVETVLNGHSGGGSFVLGYINSVRKILDKIKRIVFLDSNYDFDNNLKQGNKILNWLNQKNDHFLDVISYNDSEVKEDQKIVKTPNSGTFFKTNMMIKFFKEYINLETEKDTAYSVYDKWTGLNGRLQIIILENPDKLMLHTVLVERNGFIQSINSGTPFEGRNYIFMGAHAYDDLIQPN